jgi:hypothetical protein
MMSLQRSMLERVLVNTAAGRGGPKRVPSHALLARACCGPPAVGMTQLLCC